MRLPAHSWLLRPGLWLAALAPALAQAVDTGLEVRVNPMPRPRGGGILLYPGGEYSPHVPQLLYPGERSGPISLHMPGTRAAPWRAAAPRPAAAQARGQRPNRSPSPTRSPVRATQAPAPSRRPRQPHRRLARARPSARPDLSNVFGNAPAAAAAAKTAPAGPTTGNESLTKRSVILFAKDAPDPAARRAGRDQIPGRRSQRRHDQARMRGSSCRPLAAPRATRVRMRGGCR